MFAKMIRIFMLMILCMALGDYLNVLSEAKVPEFSVPQKILQQDVVEKPPTILKQPPAPKSRAQIEHLYAFKSSMSASDTQKVYTAFGYLPKTSQKIIDQISKDTVIGYADQEVCDQPEVSCALYESLGSEFTHLGLYIHPDHLNQPFVILHELGHIVDYRGISDARMQTFIQRFSESSKYPQGGFVDVHGKPVSWQEVFADQFAMWVTNVDIAPDMYQTKRLLSDTEFEQLLLDTYNFNHTPDIQ